MSDRPASPSQPNGVEPERRAAALAPVSRSIIIGLGGTGHQVLLDIRRRVIDKYGSLQNLPIVNFLEVDTDEDVLREQGVRDDDPAEVNLQGSEKLWAKIGDVQNLEDNLQQYPYIANWLDRNALLRGKDVQHGAGAIRARGRLALFRNYDNLQVLLEAAYKRIVDPKVMEQCQSLGLKVSQSVSVYVVGSLLGGTCSGMFLDFAYIAGRLIPGNPDVIGIFSIPPVAGGRQDHRANAYAALVELNHYCYPHTEFTAQYTPTEPEYRNRREPFTYAYLVGMNNGQQQLGSVQDQVSLVGHSIFLDLTSEFQAQKRSNRDNFQQFLIHSDRIGCPQSYMSFGLSTIHFPKDKVISACAFRLAGETVDGWLHADHPLGEDRLHQYVSDRLTELNLLPGNVNHWLRLTQDGTTLDSVIDAWRENLNEQLTRSRPPAAALASTISQHDQAMQQQNLRDSEPNADILTKSRDNVGLYLRQVQTNLLTGLRERVRQDLETWVEKMVDDPQRRQSEARAALSHARELFVNAAAGLDAAVQQNIAPLEPARDQAKNAALQKLQNDAGSMVLKMVPGAFNEAINQDRDNALHACAAYYKARLDAAVARFAARFFHELPAIVDSLSADLDAYMKKLEGIRNEFKAKETEIISSPVFVNGERLWDRDKDVDKYYNDYATPDRKGSVSSGAVRSLVDEGKLYHLRKLDDVTLRRQIVEHAQSVFTPLQDRVDVLSRFFEKYPDTPKRLEAIRQVYRLSEPFVNLKPAFYQSADDFVALAGKRQTVVGVHNGSQPGTPDEELFRNLLDQVERLAPEKFALLNNSYEVLFLQESAAFPLRLLNEVERYKQDYDFMATQGATQNPLHVRKDVKRWEPISVPGAAQQDAAWETFAVGWGAGVIQDSVDRAGRVTFTTSFRDEFSMPVDRTLGQLLKVDPSLEKEADRPDKPDSITRPLPPLQVRDIILTLCQDSSLMDGVRRGIESRLVHLGGEQFASALAAHAEEQNRRELPFYTAYQDRLRAFMTERNIRPEARAEGQPARLELSPSDTAVRPNGSVLLRARVYDALGHELTGFPINWTSLPTDVGMVDVQGRFRALRAGEASVTAAVGAIAAIAHVRVDPSAADAPQPAAPETETAPAAVPAGDTAASPAPSMTASIETPLAAAGEDLAAPVPAAGAVTIAAPPVVLNGDGKLLARCVCGTVIEPGFTLCPECGKPFVCRNQHPVKPTWKKCPFCGDDLSPRTPASAAPLTCSACHTPLEPGFRLCPECGAEVAAAG